MKQPLYQAHPLGLLGRDNTLCATMQTILHLVRSHPRCDRSTYALWLRGYQKRSLQPQNRTDRFRAILSQTPLSRIFVRIDHLLQNGFLVAFPTGKHFHQLLEVSQKGNRTLVKIHIRAMIETLQSENHLITGKEFR